MIFSAKNDFSVSPPVKTYDCRRPSLVDVQHITAPL